jgi:hypothetical protein
MPPRSSSRRTRHNPEESSSQRRRVRGIALNPDDFDSSEEDEPCDGNPFELFDLDEYNSASDDDYDEMQAEEDTDADFDEESPTTSETNTGATTLGESCAGEMEVDDDQTIIIAEAAAKAAKVALEVDRKAAATAATTAYVMVDIESCDSRRGTYAHTPTCTHLSWTWPVQLAPHACVHPQACRSQAAFAWPSHVVCMHVNGRVLRRWGSRAACGFCANCERGANFWRPKL